MSQISASPLVDILMGTYNGGAYIAAQIASLQAQTDSNWRLIVRDDGSSDSTVAMVDALAAADPRIVRTADEDGNLGFSRNFERLLSSSGASYTMFCDQDDIWLPEKLRRTRARMLALEAAHPERPILVHCDATVVDADLRVLRPRFIGRRGRKRGLPALLFANCVQGAALMVNAPLRDRMLAFPTTLPHDYHGALIAALTGVRSFVDRPLLLYRQHQDNAVGVQPLPVRHVGKRVPSLTANLQLAMDASPHVERILAHFRDEASRTKRVQAARYAYVLHGQSRLRRAWYALTENYGFSGRLDRWRLIAAIMRKQL